MKKRDSDYRSHRINSNYRKTDGGKGDMDRSDPEKYREGWERVFGKKEDGKENHND